MNLTGNLRLRVMSGPRAAALAAACGAGVLVLLAAGVLALPASAAQQTGTLLLSVTVLPVVEVEVPAQVDLSNTPQASQVAVSVNVRSNAPWQLELRPQQAPTGPFAVPGRLRWRVGEQAWQDVGVPLTWQADLPTGEMGQPVAVAFQYNPSLDDAAGQYSLPIAVTVSALVQ